MATLKDLFEEKSQDIYKRFSPSSDQLIVVKPDTDGVFGSNSRIKNDNRSVPTVSVLRDTRRVSKFLTSPEGVLFTTKQALLQTGNTFLNTKLYNPLSPALNAVPFLHIRRNIPTNTLVPSPSGLLQTTTVNTVASRFETIGQLQAFTTGKRGLLPTIGSLAKNYLVTQLKNAANSIIPLPQFYTTSRPEYKAFEKGIRIFPAQPLSQRGIVRANVTATLVNAITSRVTTRLVASTTSALNRLVPRNLRNTVPPVPNVPIPASDFTFEQKAQLFKDSFRKKNETSTSRFKSKYFSEAENPTETQFDDGIVQARKDPEIGKTTLKDPYNIAPFESNIDNFDAQGNLVGDKLNYANITTPQEEKSDIVKFTFRDATDANSNPVHFRALISSIKESIKPEFTEQRYVGRTERFVTYGGAKRGLSLSFNIVAFSDGELDGMWTKVNYLTGLAFPKGVQNGFMTPPLFKFTIGGLYDNQPCYIESLDYDFLDESITFDIDREVPFAINVNMQLSILEKRSKFHDSPFYKITEDAERTIIARRRAPINLANRINQQISQG
jgi:hypothetical protein